MSHAYDIAALRALIGPIKWEDNPILVKQKSRDFYWYSPVLKRELEAVTADVVVSPTSESEVATVLAAAYRLGIPVTARGGGTGNYGQAMPLTGGILMSLAGMNKVRSVQWGRVVCEPGALLGDVDKAAEAVRAGAAHVPVHPRAPLRSPASWRAGRAASAPSPGGACAISAMCCASAS